MSSEQTVYFGTHEHEDDGKLHDLIKLVKAYYDHYSDREEIEPDCFLMAEQPYKRLAAAVAAVVATDLATASRMAIS